MKDNSSTTPTTSNNSKLTAEHQEYFRARAIPISYAEEHGARSMTFPKRTRSEEMLKRKFGDEFPGMPYYAGATALGIPNPILAKDEIPRIRLRFDQKEITMDGPDPGSHHGEKTIQLPRYGAQEGIPVAPYFTLDAWAVKGDTSTPLYIVEAPVKAMCLSAHGMPAIGLGGVSAGAHDKDMRKEIGEYAASPEMRRINWRGRRVYICFDAGVANNPQVVLGVAILWQVLSREGADVWLVQIPLRHVEDSNPEEGDFFWGDEGPDDYIARAGVAEYRARVTEAQPLDPFARVTHVTKGLTGAARTAAVDALLGDLVFQGMLHVGGAITVSRATAAVRGTGHGKRELVQAGVTYAERLRARAPKAENPMERGDQAEASERLLRELGGMSNCVYDCADMWRFDGRIFKSEDLEALAGRVRMYAGTPIGDAGRPLMVSDAFAVGTVSLAWKAIKHEMGPQSPEGFFGGGPKAVGFKNGVLLVDASSGRLVVDENGVPKLHEHSKDHKLRAAYDFDYVPGLVPQKRKAFLETTFRGDAEMDAKVTILREFNGACLFGEAPRFQKSIICKGRGSDGKSVVCRMAEKSMPPGAASHISPDELEREYDRAGLMGKLLNVVYDLKEKTLLDTGSIKAAIVGDTLKARNPYGRIFDVPPLAGHLIALNRLPPVNDTTKGFRRRWVIIEFPNSIEDKDADVFFQEKLGGEDEIQAYVSWIVDGFAALTVRGRYAVPASSDRSVGEWMRANAQVEQFMEECLDVIPVEDRSDRKTWTRAKLVYEAYDKWAKANGHRNPKTSTNFGTELKDLLRMTPEECGDRKGVAYPVRLLEVVEASKTNDDFVPYLDPLRARVEASGQDRVRLIPINNEQLVATEYPVGYAEFLSAYAVENDTVLLIEQPDGMYVPLQRAVH